MGKLTSFVLGLFPALQQELIDAKILQALNREYCDEILRLRGEIARLRSKETTVPNQSPGLPYQFPGEPYPGFYPSTGIDPFTVTSNASTSDAWKDEPFRKSKRQQCKELEEVYLRQIEEDKADVPTEEDMSKFYG